MYDNLTDEAKNNVLTHTLQTVLGAAATSQFIVNKFKAEFERQCKLEAGAGHIKKKDYTSLSNDERLREIKRLKKNKAFREIYTYYQHTNMSCRAIAKKIKVSPSTVSRILNKISMLNATNGEKAEVGVWGRAP